MIADYLRALRAYSHNVRMILLVSAIMGFTIDGVFPVIFNLYILRMGFGPEFVGQVNSVALVVFAVAALPAGSLGTRFGARMIMVAGVLISLLSTAALAVSDLLPRAAQPLWLIVMFSLLYLGVAFYFVNSSPALVNATPGSERSRVIAIQSALGNLLAFVGGPVAGFLPLLVALAFGLPRHAAAAYRVPLIVSAGLFLLASWLILRVRNLQVQPESSAGDTPGAPPAAVGFLSILIVLSLIRFLTAAATGAALTFFNVYMDDGLGVSTAAIGMMMAVARLISVFAALAVPAIVRRWGAAHASIAAGLAVGIAMLPLALIPLWPVGGLAFVALNALSAVRYATYFVYMMEVTPPTLRTTIAGAGEFAGGMGFALVSLVGGYMIVHYGYDALFLASAFMTLCGGLWFWLHVRHRRRHAPLAVLTTEHTTEPAPQPLVAPLNAE